MRTPQTAMLLVMLAAIGASGCSPSSSVGPNASPGSASASGVVVGSQAPGSVAERTSEELIADALAASAITYEDSLSYRALALFGSAELPDAYRSSIPDMGAATELFSEIEARRSELSPTLLARLAPYLVRPSDPTSIFSTSTTPTEAGLFGGPLTASGTVWISLPAADGSARVWVQDSPGAARRLTQHAADLGRVWTAMEDVFPYPDPDQANDPNAVVNPDAAVDFYWIEASDLDPRQAACSDASTEGCSLQTYAAAGWARPTSPIRVNASSAYFVLDAGRGGDAALFELAHELAHGGEFHYDTRESEWLQEATANWVAYRVFQKLGLPPDPAYGWLPKLFEALDAPLTRSQDQWAYRAWLYFQFAAMESGDAVVTQVWEAAGAQGQQGEDAVDTAFPFEKHFSDFAVRNWNRDPVPHRYRTAPDQTFPELKPKLRVDGVVLKAADEVTLDVALPQLASAYYTYTVDPSARKVTFDNKLSGITGAHVWAIANIGGVWQAPEDLTAVASKKFCRDIPTQDLSQLVLVVSNAKVTGNLAVSDRPTLKAAAHGCGDWRGTMTATHTWNTSEGSGVATSTFEGVWTADETTTCFSQTNAPCVIYRPEGSIKWTWHSTIPPDPFGGCTDDDSGSLPAGQELHPDTQQLVLVQVDADHLKYYGLGGFVSSASDCPGGVDLTTTNPPAFFDLQEGSSSSHPVGGGNSCWSMTFEVATNATTISGSCATFEYSYNSNNLSWNLTRIGPPPA